jgi:hypothetical protein
MAKDKRATDGETFEAFSCQALYAGHREIFALGVVTTDGRKLVVEFPGTGARYLRDEMLSAFKDHPEMESWGRALSTH